MNAHSARKLSNNPNEVRIHIGEYFASAEPAVIQTVVGSCVAVCLHDPVARVGGMNHILVPGKADLFSLSAEACYAVNSMELLINSVLNAGGSRHRLKAKVFGGARMLAVESVRSDLGAQNVRFVLEFLGTESIPVLAKDLGGNMARQIHFHTQPGDVYVKKVKSVNLGRALENMQKSINRIRKKMEEPSEVTLFNGKRKK
ncbi:MAG: chemotaxis protein CheD [Deltaproteobacteria bacterium]|nr:chemotaxis protein CheD [Deltaproteobacteria bacterium]